MLYSKGSLTLPPNWCWKYGLAQQVGERLAAAAKKLVTDKASNP